MSILRTWTKGCKNGPKAINTEQRTYLPKTTSPHPDTLPKDIKVAPDCRARGRLRESALPTGTSPQGKGDTGHSDSLKRKQTENKQRGYNIPFPLP